MAARSVIGFYGHKAGAQFREFSNFYVSTAPFQFTLPAFARHDGFPESVSCEFSEKAIMVVKAALMRDRQSLEEICKARDPATCKRLGRKVKGFDAKLWEKHLQDTAFEVVRQKFASDARLRAGLLGTGDAILAEATRNDRIWGIGLDVGDARVQDPKQWPGRNVLGNALMRARKFLRDAGSDVSTSPGTAQELAAELAATANDSVECTAPLKKQRVGSSDSISASAACHMAATSSPEGLPREMRNAVQARSDPIQSVGNVVTSE